MRWTAWSRILSFMPPSDFSTRLQWRLRREPQREARCQSNGSLKTEGEAAQSARTGMKKSWKSRRKVSSSRRPRYNPGVETLGSLPCEVGMDDAALPRLLLGLSGKKP